MENRELEKAVLAGLSADSMDIQDRSTEESMDELEALPGDGRGRVPGAGSAKPRCP